MSDHVSGVRSLCPLPNPNLGTEVAHIKDIPCPTQPLTHLSPVYCQPIPNKCVSVHVLGVSCLVKHTVRSGWGGAGQELGSVLA